MHFTMLSNNSEMLKIVNSNLYNFIKYNNCCLHYVALSVKIKTDEAP